MGVILIFLIGIFTGAISAFVLTSAITKDNTTKQ